MAGSVQVVLKPGLHVSRAVDHRLCVASLETTMFYCLKDWLWQKAWSPVRGSLGLSSTPCTSAQRQSCSSERGGLPNRATERGPRSPHIRQLRCRAVPSEFHRQLEVEYLSRDSEADVGLQP
jgi:hypothetical protein